MGVLADVFIPCPAFVHKRLREMLSSYKEKNKAKEKTSQSIGSPVVVQVDIVCTDHVMLLLFHRRPMDHQVCSPPVFSSREPRSCPRSVFVHKRLSEMVASYSEKNKGTPSGGAS